MFEQLREKKILVRYFEQHVPAETMCLSIGTAPEMFSFLDAVEQLYAGSEQGMIRARSVTKKFTGRVAIDQTFDIDAHEIVVT